MNYELKFGEDYITCQFPSHWKVMALRHRQPEPLELLTALFSVLQNPTSQMPFNVWAPQFKNLLIIVPDITRYNAADRFLPPLYEKYLRNHNTKIIFALGNHRKQTVEEQRSLVSDFIFDRIESFDHDCYEKNRLISIGKTSSGLDVVVNSLLTEVDAILVTGSISFHYIAGFGGGRKGIFPGVAGYDSIIGIHKKVFNPDNPGKHPKAKTGILEGNPMHEEIMEAISFLKTPVFLINTVLDDRKNLLNIFAGDINQAHLAGCQWFMENFSITVHEKADVVIVSPGGFPKDINFIQTNKSIEYALNAVKKDGTLIVLGKCKDGLGNPDFLQWFGYGSADKMEPYVRQSDKVYAQTAYSTRLKAEYCKIILVSDLSAYEVKKMGFIPSETLQDAIDSLGLTTEKLCYVIPHGSTTLIR